MRLRVVCRGGWTVLAACSDRGDCDLLEFLSGLDVNLSGARDRILALLRHVADAGPMGLPSEKSHQIRGKIYEFIAGRLRIFYFTDDARLIVCTHGILKKSQKTPKGDIAFAMGVHTAYSADKKRGLLQVIED